jgi:hypothetical protein
MFKLNKGACLRLCSFIIPYWTLVYLDALLKNRAGSAIGLAQI